MTPLAALRRATARLPLYADAATSLQPRQLLHRPRRLIPPRLLAAGRARPPAGWNGVAQGLGVDPAPQSGPSASPHESGTFAAAGQNRRFPAPRFWRDDGDGLLFLFHLHGFGDLAAYAAGPRSAEGDAFWTAVIADWLRDSGEPETPAWHPFPLSGRIIAWCAALSAGGSDEVLVARMRASLARQARLLSRSVEHEIGGNHVLRNAVALTFAGVCLHEPRHERRGLRLLQAELGRQILADGGHEERSPSYHRAVLDDLRDVQALLSRAGRAPLPWVDRDVERMAAWLAALAGPDGDLPLLNDAWEGPRVEPSDDAFADLSDSGYVVLRGDGLQAVLDVGPLAPPHLPPHAHADALSFVLWADGRPVVVDPGVLAYSGPERDAFRATRSHNTIEVDGADQCVFWGEFRAAYMPRVTRLWTTRNADWVVVAAEHDGYARLADPVRHRRTFVWLPAGGLVVVDRLLAGEAHDAESHLHLAPDVTLDGLRAGPLVIAPLGDGPAPVVEAGRYAPHLGTARSAPVVVQRRRALPGELGGWALLRPGYEATLEGERLRVLQPAGPPLELAVA